MKVQGFFRDIGGASRMEERRRKAISGASGELVRNDPINEVAHELHPGVIGLRVVSAADISPTARTFRFAAASGELPVFQAGQYLSLHFTAGGTVTTRPYSISSAPFEARGKDGFVEITVRRRGSTFGPDWLFENLKEGASVEADLPHGQFYYEPLRDAKQVVALAGGSGITPFYSMAREIAHGKLDCDLTILYGSAKSGDIILKDALDSIGCPRVKVVHVLSDEPDWPGEKGFLSRDLIARYAKGDVSYFICGPQVMYRFVEKELTALNVPRRRIRREVFGAPRDITKFAGYPAGCAGKTFRITVFRGIRTDVIDAAADEPIAVALERAGIPVETCCRSGACGYCRSRLLSGSIFVCPESDGRRRMDRELGYFHACSSYPTGDLSIRIPIL